MGSRDEGFKLALPPVMPIAPRLHAEMPAFKAGLRIFCPQCADFIGTLRRDLFHSMTVAADTIEFHPSQHREHGQAAVCKKCGATFMAIQATLKHGRRLRINSEAGWV